jgi:hypothetical protein
MQDNMKIKTTKHTVNKADKAPNLQVSLVNAAPSGALLLTLLLAVLIRRKKLQQSKGH